MTGPLLWFLNRGTGTVLQVLFTLVVVLGAVARHQRAGRGLPRFVTHRLHGHLALLSLAFLAAHVITAVLDTYVTITWIDAVVPFVGSYQPFWLGLGTLALDLFVAVGITTAFRHRLSDAAWHAVHRLTHVAWAAAIIHAIVIGTDARTPWLTATTLACVVAVCLAWLGGQAVAVARAARRS